MEIRITEEDIRYAESKLLPEGEHFDLEERIPFIKDFSTLDLHAVPGSGKTTALLAKLLILENKLPFNDGAGILVLSHTNTAVYEIEAKIRKFCPKLFSYPNYIGTIQGFVDKFLAVQPFLELYQTRPIYIDTVLFENHLCIEFAKIYNSLEFERPGVWLSMKYRGQAKVISNQSNGAVTEREMTKILVNNNIRALRLLISDNLIVDSRNNKPLISNQNAPKNLALRNCLINTFKKGIISYDFAYELANYSVQKSGIQNLLRKRFKLIFVDEMQDMSLTQIELLEKLFFERDQKENCYQRIGDKNQAIYDNEDFDDKVAWNSTRKTITLSDTHRLSRRCSGIIEKFGIFYTPIKSNDEKYHANPKLILYPPQRTNEVLPIFAKYVFDHSLQFPEIKSLKYPVKAIGWRKNSDKGISISSYFDKFQPLDLNNKSTNSCLWLNLFVAAKDSKIDSSLNRIQKEIWNGLVLVLKYEGYKQFQNILSITRFKNYLKINFPEFYEKITQFIFVWSWEILENDLEPTHAEIKVFIITEFLPFFKTNLKYSKEFIENKIKHVNTESFERTNFYIDEATGLEIEVCTVHSVKGETHYATLYLETYFQKDGTKNSKSYESQRLMDQLKGVQINSLMKLQRVKQSARMMYVGLSRAKYLLAFAANMNHFTKEDLVEVTKMGWEVNMDLSS